MIGWIKLHRKMLNWEWYDDLPTFRLFTHLLLSVNFEKKTWRGLDILPGQIITSRKILSTETGLSEQQIRSSAINLQNSCEITIKTTNKFSIITICNWDSYQSIETVNQPAKQHPNNQQKRSPATTTKEYKKKERKEVVSNSLSLTDRQQNFYTELKSLSISYQKETLRAFYDYWSEPNRSNTRMRFEMEKTWDTARRISNWARREQGFVKHNGSGNTAPVQTRIPRISTAQDWINEEKKVKEMIQNLQVVK